MTTTAPAICPLRQRMIDDMRMRKLADKTHSHLRAGRPTVPPLQQHPLFGGAQNQFMI